MRRVGSNTFTEIYYPGCNPSFVETTDGIVMIDTPQNAIDAVRWREMLRERSGGRIQYIINTEPHGDHVLGNCYFKDVPVVGHRTLADCFVEYTDQMGGSVQGRIERAKVSDPDSVWLLEHPDFQPYHGPTILVDDEMSLQVGDHNFHLIHTPDHTGPQLAVHAIEEGVVFTGDTIFCRCKTWLQDADPWAWLKALNTVAALDVETIVPGHGEPCGKDYIAHQRQIIEDWLGTVEGWALKGVGEDEAVAQIAQVQAIDPYPLGQRLMLPKARLDEMNIRNLHRKVMARQAAIPA